MATFPFPTPPDPDLLRSATKCLCALSALDPAPASSAGKQQQQRKAGGNLTPLGMVMAGFPISPRHSRMVLEVVKWQRQQDEERRLQQQLEDEGLVLEAAGGKDKKKNKQRQRHQQQRRAAVVQALPYAVALAAALSLESPFMHIESLGEDGEDEQAAGGKAGKEGKEGEAAGREGKEGKAAGKARRSAAAAAHAEFRSEDGDALAVLRALCAYEAACAEGVGRRGGPLAAGEAFCRDHFLHGRHLKEMSALRR